MFGPFQFGQPVFADAIPFGGRIVKRVSTQIVYPCRLKQCTPINDFAYHIESAETIEDISIVECELRNCNNPPDIPIYSLNDALLFTTDLAVIVTCPEGKVCPPGSFPKVVTYPDGDWYLPDPNPNPGFPIFITMQGCQHPVTIVLPATSTQAQIAAAAQSVMRQIAQQQAECDLPDFPDEPTPGQISLGNLSEPFTCLNAFYSTQIPCFSINVPLVLQVTGLPAGITASQSASTLTLLLQGTPTVPGDYTFTVTGNAPASPTVTKDYNLVVFGITTASPLTDGEPGVAYSVVLATAGTVTAPITFSVIAGALPDGLTLNASTGEISGTPTTVETANFTIRAASSDIVCTKAFTLDIANACGDPSTVDYEGISGFFATGYDATVLPADMFNGVPFVGYRVHFTADTVPKIAVLSVHWGEGMSDAWTLLNTAASTNGDAFASSLSVFDTTVDKQLRCPVYPSGTSSTDVAAFSGTPAALGNAITNVTYDCGSMTDFTPVWGSVNVSTIGAATGSGTAIGSGFDFTINNPGDTVQVDVTATFNNTGNGVVGKLTLNASGVIIFDNTRPRLTIICTSDLDGVVWTNDTNNGTWFTGNGTYTIPFVVPATPGAVITMVVTLASVGGGLSAAHMIGTFSAW